MVCVIVIVVAGAVVVEIEREVEGTQLVADGQDIVGLSGMLEQEPVTETVLVDTLVLGLTEEQVVCAGQEVVGAVGQLEHEAPVVTVTVVEPPPQDQPELEQLGDTVIVEPCSVVVLYFVVVETPGLEQVEETVETEVTVDIVGEPCTVVVLYFVVVETPRLEQVGETVEIEVTVDVVGTPGRVIVEPESVLYFVVVEAMQLLPMVGPPGEQVEIIEVRVVVDTEPGAVLVTVVPGLPGRVRVDPGNVLYFVVVEAMQLLPIVGPPGEQVEMVEVRVVVDTEPGAVLVTVVPGLPGRVRVEPGSVLYFVVVEAMQLLPIVGPPGEQVEMVEVRVVVDGTQELEVHEPPESVRVLTLLPQVFHPGSVFVDHQVTGLLQVPERVVVIGVPDTVEMTVVGTPGAVLTTVVTEPGTLEVTVTGVPDAVVTTVVSEPEITEVTVTGVPKAVETTVVTEPGTLEVTVTGVPDAVETTVVSEPGTTEVTVTGVPEAVEMTVVTEPGTLEVTVTGVPDAVVIIVVREPGIMEVTVTGVPDAVVVDMTVVG